MPRGVAKNNHLNTIRKEGGFADCSRILVRTMMLKPPKSIGLNKTEVYFSFKSKKLGIVQSRMASIVSIPQSILSCSHVMYVSIPKFISWSMSAASVSAISSTFYQQEGRAGQE